MHYKVALVTGASAGFGFAICKALVDDGLKVIALARRKDKLLALKKELGDNLEIIASDVCDINNIKGQIQRLDAKFQDIDVLVNNAGLALGLDKLQDLDLSDIDTMINTNIKGLVYLTNLLLPKMLERNKGYIVNIGSTAGDWPYVGGNIYGATKAFVAQFSRNLRTDVHGSAIKVTCIKPGLCSDTEFSYVRFKNDESKVKATYDDVEAIKPDDIASMVSYLVSLPYHVNVNELEMMPVAQSFGGLSVKKGNIFK